MTEAARLLGEPQHRLIYLCEKGVVQPDVQDARGRGSSRRFSDRNLFEFAIALRLRDLEIAASFVGAILYVLRAFEGSVAKRKSGFRLPGSLREGHPPDIRLIISDEARLFHPGPGSVDTGGLWWAGPSRGSVVGDEAARPRPCPGAGESPWAETDSKWVRWSRGEPWDPPRG